MRYPFADNVKALRESHDLTQEELADQLEIRRQTVGNWELGQIAKPRSKEVVEQLKTFFDVTEQDLFGTLDGFAAKSGTLRHITVRPMLGNAVPIRTLGAAHAGTPDEPWQFDGEAMLLEELARRHPNCFALQVNGTCMNKHFTEHDYIFVDPDLEPRDGSIAVVSIDGETIVRRLSKGNNSVTLIAESTEPEEHEDRFYRDGDGHEIKAIGTVFWWQSKEEMR